MIGNKIIKAAQDDERIGLCFESIIDIINSLAQTNGSFVTPKFGDDWKDFAKTLTQDDILYIAWLQGRRAVLLEETMQEYCLMFSEMESVVAKYMSEILKLRADVLVLRNLLNLKCEDDE